MQVDHHGWVRSHARVVHAEGSGPGVVLLHGWPVTGKHWRLVVPALVRAGHRVLVVTLPGLGHSDIETGRYDGPYDKLALARDLRDLVDDPEIGRLDPLALVGHDWGGTVAYFLAAELGERVSALVVEEEVPPGVDVVLPEPGRSHYPSWHGPFLRAPGLAEALVPGREDSFYRILLIQSAGPAGLDPDTLDAYVRAYTHPEALAATTGYYRSAARDVAAVQAHAGQALAASVLTLGGEYGMGTAVQAALTSLTGGGPVQHLQVPGAGHYPAEQFPDVVLPALLTHLTNSR